MKSRGVSLFATLSGIAAILVASCGTTTDGFGDDTSTLLPTTEPSGAALPATTTSGSPDEPLPDTSGPDEEPTTVVISPPDEPDPAFTTTTFDILEEPDDLLITTVPPTTGPTITVIPQPPGSFITVPPIELPSPVYVSQPSYTGDCSARPPGTVCLGFSDGYIWLVTGNITGGQEVVGEFEGNSIVVRTGTVADYYHVLNTDLVREDTH